MRRNAFEAVAGAENTPASEYADDVEGVKDVNIDFHFEILAVLERSRTCFGPYL